MYGKILQLSPPGLDEKNNIKLLKLAKEYLINLDENVKFEHKFLDIITLKELNKLNNWNSLNVNYERNYQKFMFDFQEVLNKSLNENPSQFIFHGIMESFIFLSESWISNSNVKEFEKGK